jgi:hypothetical protein
MSELRLERTNVRLRGVNNFGAESNHTRFVASQGSGKTIEGWIKADAQKGIRLHPSVLELFYKRGSHTKDYAKPLKGRHFSTNT